MASAFTHAFVAAVGAQVYRPRGDAWRVYGAAMLCAVLPDLDLIGFAFGVDYADLLGHRGLTHSLLIAVLVGIVATLFVCSGLSRFSGQWWAAVLFFSCATASHGLLDAMTDGGLGVAFFSPLDRARYFFPWRPLRVPPIGIELFFSRWGLQVIASELLWIWLPGLAIGAAACVVRRWIGSSRRDHNSIRVIAGRRTHEEGEGATRRWAPDTTSGRGNEDRTGRYD
ncbi:MAG: metal-dependent hydrolase [Nitrospirae bacterium]|nr:metal-dependent hydrolase [Nitrospirota bacterium]